MGQTGMVFLGPRCSGTNMNTQRIRLYMRVFGFSVFLLFSLQTIAQTGIIQGRIGDATSNDAIPFANVFIQGTT
ncbi:MAG: hypothetical protein ACI85G_001497, partial [Psychroserpens sp.]